jgi:hypothetical protein
VEVLHSFRYAADGEAAFSAEQNALVLVHAERYYRTYDAFLFLDESQAMHPLHTTPALSKPPDTYPWGV